MKELSYTRSKIVDPKFASPCHYVKFKIRTVKIKLIILKIHSIRYNSNWYQLSPKAQKLLLIIMKRGSIPATFVVGKIFTPSLQFFTSVKIFRKLNKFLYTII